jgi:hypothetical protein
MRLMRNFLNLSKRMGDRISFLDYKIKQRRALKRQKAKDPNIYPLS